MLIESGQRNELFSQKIPLWLENDDPKMIKLIVESIESKDWREIDWLINIIMSSSNDKLISRILRRKKSIEADKYRKEILLDGDRNAIVRSRIIEDLFGKKQDEEITKITEVLTKNFRSKIKLKYKHDESLIGSLLVQVGNTMVDTSIKNKLQQIENRMIEA